MNVIEPFLESLATALAPHAAIGVLAAAAVIALSRMPLLSIAALMAACAFLGAFLGDGEAGLDVGMAVMVAGAAAGLALLVSGGSLWTRPGLRNVLARLRRIRAGEIGSDSGDADGDRRYPDNVAFRLCAVAVVALAARGLAPLLSPGVAAQEALLVLWLVGMGMVAGFSQGSAIVAGTGAVTVASAALLLVPALISDVTRTPMAYRAICAAIILGALGFALVAQRRPAHPAEQAEAAGTAETAVE